MFEADDEVPFGWEQDAHLCGPLFEDYEVDDHAQHLHNLFHDGSADDSQNAQLPEFEDGDGCEEASRTPRRPTAASVQSPRSPAEQETAPNLPVQGAMKKRRLRRKTTVPAGLWTVHAQPEEEPEAHPLQGEVAMYAKHFALKKFNALGSAERRRLTSTVRSRRWRRWKRLSKGEEVEFEGKVYTGDDQGNLEDLLDRLEIVEVKRFADNVDLSLVERGANMHRLLQMLRAQDTCRAQLGQPTEHWMRQQRSTLLTFNGDWGSFDRPEDLGKNMSDVVAWLQQHAVVLDIVKEREAWCAEQVLRRRVDGWAFALELCPHSFAKEEIRIHLHLWLAFGSVPLPYEELKFRGGKGFLNAEFTHQMARDRMGQKLWSGAFYVNVEKIGTVCRRGSVEAFVDYRVKDFWIQNMYSSGKITGEVAHDLFLKCVVRAESNIRQLRYVENEKQAQEVRRLQEENEAVLRSMARPFKTIPVVQQWLSQYDHVRGRYKFLVLQGPSQTGKTKFAMSLASPGCTFYVDCSGSNPHPNFQNFVYQKHQIVLLDELSPYTAICLKKLIQASNEICVLGSSPTQQHSYSVYCYRTRFIVCTNVWEVGMTDKRMTEDDVDWLMQNSFRFEANEKLYT